MTKCLHDAWEDLAGGGRRCADCRAHLKEPNRIVLIDPLPRSRDGFATGTAQEIVTSRYAHVEDHPRVFNGQLSLRRFRITVEVINEPIDVLRDRLRKLWRESEPNIHARSIMHEAARELGIELDAQGQGADYRSGAHDAFLAKQDAAAAAALKKHKSRPRKKLGS